MTGLRVLIADDERPALEELAFLLAEDERIGTIERASTGTDALRILSTTDIDAAFLDIHMPGLTGLDLARALARFDPRPPVVFVTADEERAIEAFDLEAADYLLKPVRGERLRRAIDRLVATRRSAAPAASQPGTELVAVTLGGTTRMVRRDAIRYVQAQGDYTRLHTDDGGFLIRAPISDLEQQWAEAGFVRVHRSYLVALGHVTKFQLGGAAPSVVIGETTLPVSRRLLPALRERVAASRVRPRP